MTRMTGPDCAVMFNLINTHKHTHKTHTALCRTGMYVMMDVCMYVSVFIKLHITAQSGPVMYVCMYVCMVITYSRVEVNRVRLPILLVVN